MPIQPSNEPPAEGRRNASVPSKVTTPPRRSGRRGPGQPCDNARARYRIEEDGSDLRYWVVGCTYKDTHFCEPADKQGELWYGPFESYESAKAEWNRLAWSSVDDAHARFRIERRVERRGYGT